MSVINTNITSMIGQSNLSKSQNALQTSMERLSSGLRINSAKDDAAGQAIANRMTAQITGLAQAQRNANDGISLAQTAEGSLNQVNDNLQRIRELSVQAQNATNSEDDLKSIQDEIGQRLSEIDRISGETNFNGVEVLNTNQGLQIQVGANDSEVISVNLQTINAKTLGLSSFDITKPTISSNNLSDAISDTGQIDQTVEATIKPNSFSPAQGQADTLDGVFKKEGSEDLVARAKDGQFYELEKNEFTGKWTWDSSQGAFDGDVDTSQEIENLPVKITAAQGSFTPEGDAATYVDGDGNTQTLSFDNPTELFLRNDVEGEQYAILGSDNNYYAVTIADKDVSDDDPSDWSFNIVLNQSDLEQVSASNVPGSSVSTITGATEPLDTVVNIYQNEINPADVPSAEGLFHHAGSPTGYAVKSGDNYYVGSVNDSGEVTWTSDSKALNPDQVGDATNVVRTGEKVDVNVTGLGEGETLHEILDKDGNGTDQYVIKGTDAFGNTTFHSADVDSEGIVTKGSETLNVDPLKALDDALNKVDNLRSELGAVQNRFEDAITNLSTNETNLAAARSRIEDADYAVEVANMTRAQILQQAGTSVLAQANQIPQNVLSLLG